MKKTPILLAVLFLSFNLSAQQSDELTAYPVPEIYSSPEVLTVEVPMQTLAIGETVESKVAAPGTYQLIRRINAPEDILPDYYLMAIEKMRDETGLVMWQIADNTKIKILPSAEILKSDFNPVKDQVVYMEF